MPARGGGFALLKWVTSFPGNLADGLPTVNGVVCLSDAHRHPARVARRPAVTALRTGAVAAVASLRARPGGRPQRRDRRLRAQRLVGRALPRRRRLRPGVCSDPRAAAAAALAAELGWSTGDLAAALACDIVCTITPGAEIVVERGRSAARACT